MQEIARALATASIPTADVAATAPPADAVAHGCSAWKSGNEGWEVTR
jgi:hypothetical protein